MKRNLNVLLGFLQCSAIAALAVLAQHAPALAQQRFGTQPIKIIMPYAAGGPWDVMIRILAKNVGEKHSQNVVVENRPGGNTIVGANACRNSQPDGYTICVLSMSSMMLNPLMHKNLSYNSETDFEPVTKLAFVDHVVIMGRSVPANNFKELVEYSKANPDKLNYASNGVGGDAHLGIEWLKGKTGLKITHVPFQGMAPAMLAIEGGQVHLLSLTPGGGPLQEKIKTGEFKAILVDTDKRLAILPDVPSYAEAGLPQFQARTWLGLFAPKGTPKDIVAILNREFADMVKDKDFQQRYLVPYGFDPSGSMSEELARHMKDTREAAAELVRLSGVQPQ